MAVNVASSDDLKVEYFLHPDKITGEKTGNQVIIFGQLAEKISLAGCWHRFTTIASFSPKTLNNDIILSKIFIVLPCFSALTCVALSLPEQERSEWH